MKNSEKKKKFLFHNILYSMGTCFWWLPSSKCSPFVGNWKLSTEGLGFASVESFAIAYVPCFWRLRWGISLLPRNFLKREDISWSEVTIKIDIPIFFSSKTLVEVSLFQISNRYSIFSHGNASTRNHHFQSKGQSRFWPNPLSVTSAKKKQIFSSQHP